MNQALEKFKNGKLIEAISLLNDALKKNPTDIDSRSLLVEMLCFNGEFERADKQLDFLAHQTPELAMNASLLRLTLKGAQARADFFEHGTLPEFFDKNSELELQLAAVINLKENDIENAVESLKKIEKELQPINIKYNGQAVEEFRDLDDVVGRFIEVIGGNGKYYWIHISQIEELAFIAPVDRLDILWRRAEILLKNGMKGEVRIPTCYIGSDNDASKLAKVTEWNEVAQNLVRGIGQRTFLIGNEAVPIMDMEKIEAAA
ncbi:type VI secretion system accessory protein TagJ [Aliikangiella maris]|uniref:Type VI secretion system accessory protein TagJ n=2 Tax=Aliikangiella maris TaxID=3162458 RepID=A0ABV2BSR6_9GAMM